MNGPPLLTATESAGIHHWSARKRGCKPLVKQAIFSRDKRFPVGYREDMPIITSTAELAAACKRFSRFDILTVDTEFMRETTYWPKLCVIQLASPEEAVIVDAMAPEIDLDPFFKLMG